MKLLISAIALTLAFSVSANKEKDPVVAEVLGKKIKKSTFLKYHQQNLGYVKTKKITKERSLNDLVDRVIGIEGGKKAGIHKRPEIVKKMNDIIYHAFISKELEPRLKKIRVTDEDIKDYYKKFPEYKTAQILLRVRTLPSDEEVAKMFDKAQEIYAQVSKDSDNFAAYAKKHSQSPQGQNGGNLGFQPRARMSQEYFENIHNKKAGTIVKPFRSQYGFHIVKVLGVKEYKQIDMNLYKKIVYDQKRDQILEDYFAEKRKASKVKMYKDKL